jgi:hypothetical protein
MASFSFNRAIKPVRGSVQVPQVLKARFVAHAAVGEGFGMTQRFSEIEGGYAVILAGSGISGNAPVAVTPEHNASTRSDQEKSRRRSDNSRCNFIKKKLGISTFSGGNSGQT